eukprot:1136360-Pelagomonas_calceolata.AAC.2
MASLLLLWTPAVAELFEPHMGVRRTGLSLRHEQELKAISLEPRLGTINTRAKPTRKAGGKEQTTSTKKDWRGRSKGPLGKDKGAGAKRA